jgi:dihydroxyacetone kinase-like predicted kinase
VLIFTKGEMKMEERSESVTESVESDAVEHAEKVENVEVVHTPEELTKRLVEVSAENKTRRLEAKEARERAEKLAAEVEALRKEKLSEQGNFKKLYEETSEKLKQKEAKFQEVIGNYALSSLKSSVESELVKAGCTRTDAVLALLDSKIMALDYNDEFKPEGMQVAELVKESQEQYPEFYRQETPKIKDAIPSGKFPEKKLADLSKEEIMNIARSMDKR